MKHLMLDYLWYIRISTLYIVYANKTLSVYTVYTNKPLSVYTVYTNKPLSVYTVYMNKPLFVYTVYTNNLNLTVNKKTLLYDWKNILLKLGIFVFSIPSWWSPCMAENSYSVVPAQHPSFMQEYIWSGHTFDKVLS